MAFARLLPTIVLTCGLGTFGFANEVPEGPTEFLVSYCLDCHDADTQKGEINLDVLEIDWSTQENHQLWERVLNAVNSGEMPPVDKAQPKPKERESVQAWIHDSLMEHTKVGGTLARRLNKAEYLASVQSLFGLGSKFELPPGFPADSEHHGFDNVGEGLVLSPPLLEAYAETARLVADEIFPPKRKAAKPVIRTATSKDLVIGYSSGKVVGDALRLGMKCDPITRSCTWPSKIEVDTSGVYKISADLSSFRPAEGAEPMLVKILAYSLDDSEFTKHGCCEAQSSDWIHCECKCT